MNPVGKSVLDGSVTHVIIDMTVVIGSEVLGETSLKDCVERYNETNKCEFELKRAVLLMSQALMCSFFEESMCKIVDHVKQLVIENPFNYIYLCGGFGECKMLQNTVKVEFQTPSQHVIVPLRPDLIVLKGTVFFGLQKGITIQSRVACYTYAFDCEYEYDHTNG